MNSSKKSMSSWGKTKKGRQFICLALALLLAVGVSIPTIAEIVGSEEPVEPVGSYADGSETENQSSPGGTDPSSEVITPDPDEEEEEITVIVNPIEKGGQTQIVETPPVSLEPGEVPEIGDMDAIMAYTGAMYLNDVDQGLVAEFVNVTTNNVVGGIGQMRLYTSLSSTNNNDYVTVKVDIPDIPGISFPQFATSDVMQIATHQGRNIEITLVRGTNGKPQHFEYKLLVGDTFVSLIRVMVPNGYSTSPTVVTFNDPYIDQTRSNFPQGVVSVQGGELTFTGTFGWNNVAKSASPTSVSVAASSTSSTGYALSGDISYTLGAANPLYGSTTNTIFTKEYTATDVLTLPTGVSFPSGANGATLNGAKTALTYAGKTLATFSAPVESAVISGKKLTVVYKNVNSTLDANGNQASGKVAADIQSMNLTTKLHGANLEVSSSYSGVAGQKITNQVSFNAKPCKGDAVEHNSSASAEVSITVPQATFTINKTNNPGSSTKITSTNTEIEYTIEVKNTGLGTETITVADTVPTGSVYVIGSASSNLVTPTFFNSNLAWNNVSINAGQTLTFKFKVRFAQGTTNGTTIRNTARLMGGSKTYNSNTVTNTYDTSDNLSINKEHGVPGSVVYKDSIVPYTIKVTNFNATPSLPYSVVDTLPEGIRLSAAQLTQLRADYPGVTYDETTGVITFPAVSYAANSSVTYSFNATVVSSMPDGTYLTNYARIPELNLSSSASVVYRTRKINMSVNKEIVSGPTRVSETSNEAVYETTFRITVKNGSVPLDFDLENPLYFEDVMSAGLRPKGAGNAASGTLSGTDNRGQTVTGTWTRINGSGSAYIYTIRWDIPTRLAANEVYWIQYVGEVIVPLRDDGTFDTVNAFNYVNVRGDANVTPGGGSGGTGGSGTEVEIKPDMSVEKKIIKVNNTTGSWKTSELYAGDVITYRLTLTNTQNSVTKGYLYDILPFPTPGSGFVWELDTNVFVTATNVTPVLASNQIIWRDLEIPANGSVNVDVTVHFPRGELFDTAFIDANMLAVNNMLFLPEKTTKRLESNVTHTIKEEELTFGKTASRISINNSDEAQYQTSVFTLTFPTIAHGANGVIVTDDLSEVIEKFNVTAINYGAFAVTDTNGAAAGYTLELTYKDGTTSTFTVAAGASPSVVYPAGKSITDIEKIRWIFGDVNTLTATTAPTISVALQNGASAGTVTNNMYLLHNNKNELQTVDIRVNNSAILMKTLVGEDGVRITNWNGDNPAQVGEYVTYHISYTHSNTPTNWDETVSSRPPVVNGATWTDLQIVDYLQHPAFGKYGEDITVYANVYDAQGNLDPVSPISFTFDLDDAVIDGDNRVLNLFEALIQKVLGNGGGSVRPGSIIGEQIAIPEGIKVEFSYTLRVSESFKNSVQGYSNAAERENGRYRLLNNVEVGWGGTDDWHVASTGPYGLTDKKLYIHTQLSVVGTTYQSTNISNWRNTQNTIEGARFYATGTPYPASSWNGVGNNNFQFTGMPAADETEQKVANTLYAYSTTRHIIYDFTIANSYNSGQVIMFVDREAFASIHFSKGSRVTVSKFLCKLSELPIVGTEPTGTQDGKHYVYNGEEVGRRYNDDPISLVRYARNTDLIDHADENGVLYEHRRYLDNYQRIAQEHWNNNRDMINFFGIGDATTNVLKPGQSLSFIMFVTQEYYNPFNGHSEGSEEREIPFTDMEATLRVYPRSIYTKELYNQGLSENYYSLVSNLNPVEWEFIEEPLTVVNTFSNSTDPSVSSNPANTGKGEWTTVRYPSSLSSYQRPKGLVTNADLMTWEQKVTVKRPEQEISLTKQASGFYTKASNYGTYQALDGSKTPDVDDAIEFEVKITNNGNNNFTNFYFSEQVPLPYEVLWIEAGLSRDNNTTTKMITDFRDAGSVNIYANNLDAYIANTKPLKEYGKLPLDGLSVEDADLSDVGYYNTNTYNVTYSRNKERAGAAEQNSFRGDVSSLAGNTPLNTIGLFVGPMGLGDNSLSHDANRVVSGNYVPGVIKPGETLTIKVVMGPAKAGNLYKLGGHILTVSDYADQIPVDYATYDSTSYIYQLTDNLIIRRGQPLRYSDYGHGKLPSADGQIIGAKVTAPVTIGGIFASVAQKSVTSSDGERTAVGNSVDNSLQLKNASEEFSYELKVTNRGEVVFSNMVLIDRLPMINDVGAVNVQSDRGSDFAVSFAENPDVKIEWSANGSNVWNVVPGATIQYKNVAAGQAFSTNDWSTVAGIATGWSATPQANSNALRVDTNGFALPINATLRITFNAKVANPSTLKAGQIAWNSYGYRYQVPDSSQPGGTRMIAAEPAKVGVQLANVKLKIDKKVNELGNPLQGAVFGIFTDLACNNEVARITTGTNGIAISSNLPLQTYYVKEVISAPGYKPSNTVYTVPASSMTPEGTIVVNTQGDIVNSKKPVKLTLTKAIADGTLAPTSNITISVTGVFDGHDGVMTRSQTFTPAQCNGNYTWTIEGIIVGNTYKITESGGGREYNFTAGGEDVDGGVVTVDANGNFTLSKDSTIDIVNKTPEAGKLYLKKVVNGTDGGETFTITVTGVFSNSNGQSVTRTFTFNSSERDTPKEVPNVLYGQLYTITETVGGENYDVSYSHTVVNMKQHDVTVTVTNTPKTPGKLIIKKTVDGYEYSSASFPAASKLHAFVVSVTGIFEGQSGSTTKQITLNAGNNFEAEVPGVKLGAVYQVVETGIPSGYSGTPTYTGLNSTGMVNVGENDVTVTVNNMSKSSGVGLVVKKTVLANTLNIAKTFQFVLLDANDNEVATGSVTTATNGTVEWNYNGAQVTTLTLQPGYYFIKEIMVNEPDYQFNRFTDDWNRGTMSGENTYSIQLRSTDAATTVTVTAENKVRTGSLVVEKEMLTSAGARNEVPAGQDIYFGLYQSGTSTMVGTPVKLVWNDGAKAYNNVTFTNVPYGKYQVYELVHNGTDYVRANLASSGFQYAVSGEGQVIEFNSNSPDGPLTKITNREKKAALDIDVEKKFQSDDDKAILENKTFTVRLRREDNQIISGQSTYVDFTLTKNNGWKVSSTGAIELKEGNYILYELGEVSGGWENLSITGINGGTVMAAGVTGVTNPIAGLDNGVRYVKFTVGSTELGSTISLSVTATNRATSKKLATFNVIKSVDDISGLNETQRTFTFNLYKVGSPDTLIATGTLVKSNTSSESVVTWKTPGGAAWNSADYLWDIGETYRVVEVANNNYTLKNASGTNATQYRPNNEYLAGVDFIITENTNVISLLFENVRKVASGMTVKKVVVDKNGVTVPVASWHDDSKFTFGIYELQSGNMISLGTLMIDNSTPDQTVAITANTELRPGNDYYIRELTIEPQAGYEFVEFTSLTKETVNGQDYYKFKAADNLQIIAKNKQLDVKGDLELIITKKLFASDGTTPYVVKANAQEGKGHEKFVFEITDNTTGRVFHQVVTINAGSSTGTVKVTGLYEGSYTVKELDTNWRFKLMTERSITLTVTQTVKTFEFKNKYVNDQWVDDKMSVTNKLDGDELRPIPGNVA
ncbi:DUF11 domain-containing protein [Eubacteriales bacterium OttesenSCG-928-K08]|nr:DUF11 domain-containing protein [Eubacteriales bacterium OttesenSCG-928-K08]